MRALNALLNWVSPVRIAGICVFIVLMNVLPPEVVFYRWLMFTLTTIFWLVVSVIIATVLLSLWADHIGDN